MNLALDKHDVRNKSDGSISDCIHNILIRPKVYGPRLRHHTTVIVKAKCPQDILSTEVVQWMEKVSKEEEIDNGTDGEPSPPMVPESIPSMSGDGDHLYDVDFYRYCGALREEWQEYNWKIKNLE
ncbi:unnamed protein product [Rotaria sordida]|uniref:Uncharacterized protein n=1 Tax=Rotaria sordida TaxID=392033 RepID=A0A819YE88_9BILA|nr:unnamed protein product [Rotaria sordida]CAF4148303.1 unnamed protein product [Rotaria sordida]